MRVELTPRFERDVRGLDQGERDSVVAVVRALPAAVGAPHLHAGLGLRKLHRRGVWEARIGLGLRLVFTIEHDLATLLRVGTHDDVRRYLRER